MKGWAAILCLAGLIFSYWFVYNQGVKATETRLELHYLTEQQKLRDQHDREMSGIKERYDNAIQLAQERETALKADAAVARAANVSLRESLAKADQRIREATRPALDEYASTVTELFGECSAAYTELAEKADGHASDAMKFRDAWPKQQE